LAFSHAARFRVWRLQKPPLQLPGKRIGELMREADDADAVVDAAVAKRAHEPIECDVAGVAADIAPLRPLAVPVNLGRNRLPIANSTLMPSWMPTAVAKPTGMLCGARDS
jgi:hypothetical protein